MKIVMDVRPSDLILGVIRHDYELYRLSRPSWNEFRNGRPFDKDIEALPETVKAQTGKEERVFLTYDLEWAWFDEFASYAPPDWTSSQIRHAWRVFLRDEGFICNGMGTRSRYSHVLGGDSAVGPDAGMIGVECIVTGGATVHLVDGIERNGQLEAYCLNARKPLPDLASFLHGRRGLTYFATNSKRTIEKQGLNWVITREDEVVPMGHLGSNHCLAFFISNTDTVKLPADRVRILRAGQLIPSPYVP